MTQDEAISKEKTKLGKLLTKLFHKRIIDHIVAEHLNKDVEWVRGNKKTATKLLKNMFYCPKCKEKD